MPRDMPEPVMPMGALDLNVIDEAYGDYADLYSDVLKVDSRATPEQVQLAYFDRRSELFTLLAKLDSRPQDDKTLQQRIDAERKMDSVVLAVRILGDPEQRLEYDHIRKNRLYQRSLELNPSSSGEGEYVKVKSSKSTKDKHKKEKRTKKQLQEHYHLLQKQQQKQKQKQRKEEKIDLLNQSLATQDTEHDLTDEEGTRVDARSMSMSMDTYDTRQDDGDMTLYTLTDPKVDDPHDPSFLSCLTNSRIIRKISAEISGACEDTLVSVDQVFHAFTLSDKDIKAVTKRIAKAQRQLDG